MEDANINTAMEAEKEFVNNPICITAYEQHQKYLRDKHAREKYLRKEGIAQGRKEGEAIGYEKGKLKTQKEIAISMKEHGMSELAIADILKISLDEVKLILQ